MVGSQKFDNNTLDVLNKGCFDLYESVACGRISILVFLSIVTLFFVVLKIIKYHCYKHSQMHHYAIFYISAIQCIISGASFMFGIRYPQLHFAAIFFKLYQFILICHLHWSMAARARHRDDIVQHVINPILCLYTLYCITVVLMGMVDISGTWTECFRPYWLMLSSADFLAVQSFAMVALYVTNSNKQVVMSLMKPAISSQTRDFWLVIAVYEISSAVSVVFDAIMILIGKNESGCSGIYSHDQLYYSSSIVVIMILKYFVPIWTLLCVFQPTRVKSRPSEVALTSHYNMDGSCYNQYHKMFLPNFGSSGAIPYPALSSYPTNSLMFGAIGDFSDSSPETSPTITRYCTGLDDEMYCGYEKHFINVDQQKEMLENQYRMEQNRQNLEKTLDMDMNNDKTSPDNTRYLTTINEESTNNVENAPE